MLRRLKLKVVPRTTTLFTFYEDLAEKCDIHSNI